MNLKNYGDRFGYQSGFKTEEDFFMYIAQFGKGVIVWGVVLADKASLSDTANYLKSKPWRRGGCPENSRVDIGGDEIWAHRVLCSP